MPIEPDAQLQYHPKPDKVSLPEAVQTTMEHRKTLARRIGPVDGEAVDEYSEGSKKEKLEDSCEGRLDFCDAAFGYEHVDEGYDSSRSGKVCEDNGDIEMVYCNLAMLRKCRHEECDA
jgi:hypothetical protein